MARLRNTASALGASVLPEKGLATPLSSSSLPSSRLHTPGSACSYASFSSPFVFAGGSPFVSGSAGGGCSTSPSTPLAKRPRRVHLSSLAGSPAGGSTGVGSSGDLSRRGLEAVESAWAEEDWGF